MGTLNGVFRPGALLRSWNEVAGRDGGERKSAELDDDWDGRVNSGITPRFLA